MEKRRQILGTLVVCGFLALVPSVVQSAPYGSSGASENLLTRITQLEERVAELGDSMDGSAPNTGSISFRRELQQDFENYIQRLDAERRQFQDFLETLIKWFGVFIGAAVALLGWRSYRDAKAFVEGQARRLLSHLIDERVGSVEERLDAYDRVATRELWFSKSEVLVTGTKDQLGEMRNALEVMRSEISLEVVPYSEDLFEEECSRKRHDLIIYAFNPGKDGHDPQLARLTALMAEHSWEIPILVYTGYRSRVAVEEYQMRDWMTMANSPVTLVVNTFSLTHAFVNKRRTAQ